MVLMLLDTTCINEADNLTFGVAITEVADENSTFNWIFSAKILTTILCFRCFGTFAKGGEKYQ